MAVFENLDLIGLGSLRTSQIADYVSSYSGVATNRVVVENRLRLQTYIYIYNVYLQEYLISLRKLGFDRLGLLAHVVVAEGGVATAKWEGKY